MVILIVDDEKAWTRVVKIIFNKAGYYSESVSTGIEAIHAILLGGYDLALLDFRLPDIDGIRIANIVRENGSRIPLFLVTGDVTVVETRDDYVTAGFAEVVPKAITATNLIDMVNRHTGGTGRLPLPSDRGVEKVEFTPPVPTNPLPEDIGGGKDGCAP